MTIHIFGIHGPHRPCTDSNAIKRNCESTTELLRDELAERRPLKWPVRSNPNCITNPKE